MSNQEEYWASADVEEVAADVIKRVDTYYEFLLTSGIGRMLRKSYAAYYKAQSTGAQTLKIGEQGEFTQLNINHYRNLLGHLLTMTTQQPPAFEPRATNTDYESQAQVILARGLLDYYVREKKLGNFIKTAVELALVMTEGFVRVAWNPQGGEVYGVDPDSQVAIHEGDVKYDNLNTFQVIRDYRKNSWESHQWVIARTTENRWDLMAQYPELKDKILAAPHPSDDKFYYKLGLVAQLLQVDDEDDVAVFEFYHKKSPALPNGRYMKILSSSLVLFDGPTPYTGIPVYRIVPDQQLDTGFGYTIGFDLLPIQEVIDALHSTVVTNQSTFGVQNIMTPKGHTLGVTQLSGGLNLIEYDSKLGKPEALNLTQTPVEIFNFILKLEKTMETLSGVNSVARGNPEASLKSGAALALVQSMAIQFNIDLQQSYVGLIEDVGTATINLLREFAKVPRVATIVGKNNRSLMKEFSSKDIQQINRVTVDMGSPLQRTTAGKVQLAETLMSNSLIDNADQYIQVLTTGRLEPIIEGKQSELMLIRAENEQLAEGVEQPVIVTDNHHEHVMEHKSVLSSPEARLNAEVLAATLKHISEHIQVLQDPQYNSLLAVLGFAAPQQAPDDATNAPATGGATVDAINPVMAQAAQVKPAGLPGPPAGADAASAEVIEGNRSVK